MISSLALLFRAGVYRFMGRDAGFETGEQTITVRVPREPADAGVAPTVQIGTGSVQP